MLYIANSGFIQKDKISLIKLNKTTGDIENLLDINYVPIPNRPNQIRSRMEYGAMTQVNATVFICGTLHKYTEMGEFTSSSVFVGRVDPEQGQSLTYMHSWGEIKPKYEGEYEYPDYPDATDVCKKLEFDKDSYQVVMFVDAKSENLQENCKMDIEREIPLGYHKCSLIILFNPG